ncbi:multidrug effflux MFS transporter [Acinetobacter ursingii]|uniref:multidrug effflux MFS transporter n=1 Tax=Acinetobacter ursingii TaxID=108980 RepID=UPI00124D38F1|nr:multidrug effflux MFS transporter [Acinetobacter ursingii]MCU4307201.1 multidrug effflux MFS transporter [Acinetobacter ursingii]MCU4373143.1 multidrug effflux MFS transporter [Acinetobacter ursingii]MDG9993152.1 multidrug effflux MFS transporter [Acinetobacter ursingii]MDH0205448.1 multidrug effflux MFS transporter [Acinetobacter ursingii]
MSSLPSEVSRADQPLNTSSLFFMLILSALMAFTSLSTDIYLPAMPQMEKDLHGNVELTITGFLIGFSVAQLIWGPISDRIGRKIPLFIGMILFVIGSIGCALSQSIEQIVFWRVFQAFGACTGPMLARAMIRDLYAKTQAAQMLSTLTIVMAIAPIAGPLLGGQIIKFSTWHSIFGLLAVIGCLMFISLFFLTETHHAEKRISSSIFSVFSNYCRLLGNWQFMRYTLSVTFFYVAAYTFIVGSPFVYISYYGIDAQHYGWLFAVNIVGVMGLSFINRNLVQRFSLDRLLKVTTAIATVALLILSVLFNQHIGRIYSIIALVFIFFSMNGMIAANSTAAALDGVGEIAGSASALIGSLQYGSGVISSLLLAWLSKGTPETMIMIMTIFTIFSAVMVFIPSRQSIKA